MVHKVPGAIGIPKHLCKQCNMAFRLQRQLKENSHLNSTKRPAPIYYTLLKMEFKRPKDSVYPLIYDKFQIKRENSDKYETLIIQDLTEDFFDDSVRIIIENHARGAVFHRAAGTLWSDSGIERVSAMYRNVFKEKISLICLTEKTKEIVGINALYLMKHTKREVTDDPNFNLLNETLDFIENEFNVLDHYGVDRCVTAAGLCVVEKFRCCGIATRILQSREHILKTIGIDVTSTLFTTIGAQKAAKAAGYNENYSISYEKLAEIFPRLNFSHVASGYCKILSKKV